MENQSVLEVRDLEVTYRQREHPAHVLDRISFDLRRGEIVSLLGESGSGKSTIAKALSGLLPPSAHIAGGSLRIGEDVFDSCGAAHVPWERIRGKRIGMLVQDARQALHPLMKIREQFADALRFHRMASAAQVPPIAFHYLDLLGFADPERVLESYPFELSGGMCQRVCLALALCLEPAVLLADEPTSALDTVSQRDVLELLSRSREKLGLSVLLITHDIAVASAISDRALVLNRGRLVEAGDARTVLRSPRSDYTRQLLASRERIRELRPPEPRADGEAVLEVVQVSKGFAGNRRVLRDVDLTVPRGRIVGILGESGSGKSTLAKCIAGLEAPDAGKILYKGRDVGAMRGAERRRLCRYIQLIFQDARACLHPGRTALELVQEPLRYMRIGNGKERREKALALLQAVGIGEEAMHRRPPQLSTGQCQRIAIARALAPGPDLLLCDEAVSALDMTIQAQILSLLHRLQESFGFSLVMISHDTRMLRSFCHEIAVMEGGAIAEVRPAERLHESERPYTQLLLACASDIEGALSRKGEESNDRHDSGDDRRDAARNDTEQQPSERGASLVEV